MALNQSSPQSPGSQESTRSGRSFYSPQDRQKKLREVLDQTNDLQEDTSLDAVNKLKEVVTEADDLHGDIEDRTTNQDQIVLDSMLMKASSRVIQGCMESLNQETNDYNGAEFAKMLHEYMDVLPDETAREPNWELLGREASTYFQPCGSHSTLLHRMEPIPKAEVEKKASRAQRKTKAKDPLMPATRPDEVVAIENDDNPVDKSVAKINRLIKKYHKHNNEPLNFFKLIIHPDDFGKTVENMLHVAFLVRDGKMALVLGEKGHLIIEPIPNHMQEEQQNTGQDTNRIANIPSLTMEKWRFLTEALEIIEPMINL